MPDSSINGAYQPSMDSRHCDNNVGGIFGGCCCDSEILFFIIIFLLLFTNFGCGCSRG